MITGRTQKKKETNKTGTSGWGYLLERKAQWCIVERSYRQNTRWQTSFPSLTSDSKKRRWSESGHNQVRWVAVNSYYFHVVLFPFSSTIQRFWFAFNEHRISFPDVKQRRHRALLAGQEHALARVLEEDHESEIAIPFFVSTQLGDGTVAVAFELYWIGRRQLMIDRWPGSCTAKF
jgi:hypothetical protein